MKRQIHKFCLRAEGSSFLGIDPQKDFKQLLQVIPIVKQLCQVLHFILISGILLGFSNCVCFTWEWWGIMKGAFHVNSNKI